MIIKRKRHLISFLGAFVFGLFAVNVYNMVDNAARFPRPSDDPKHVNETGWLWESIEDFENFIKPIFNDVQYR